MKVKMNQELVDPEGKVIPGGSKSKLLLKDVCVAAILGQWREDTQNDKWEKYVLFKKLQVANNEVELTPREIGLIKKCIGIFNPPLIMGQCFEMIEGKI